MRKPILLVLVLDLVAILAAVLIYAFTGKEELGEGGFLTKLSGAQLLAISVICFLVFRIRNVGVEKKFSLKNPAIVWGLMAAGFFFLMADEMFKIHESIDEMIHSAFSLKETGVTDRIDDVLILLYALIGIGVIWAYRREFLIMKAGLPFLFTGFVFLFLTIGFDLLTNRDDVLRALLGDADAGVLETWLVIGEFAEEGTKILSEGFFVVAFYAALQAARKTRGEVEEQV